MGKLLIRLRRRVIHSNVQPLCLILESLLLIEADAYLSFAGISRQMKDLTSLRPLWLRCARISLADLVTRKEVTLLIARSAGSGAGGPRSNPKGRSLAERTREP